MTKRIRIEAKDLDDNNVVVYVTQPTREEEAEAQIESSKMFKSALLAGAIVRKGLEIELEKQGIWSKEKESELEKLNTKIRKNLILLKKGGIKISRARKLAIDIRIDRLKITALLSERNEYDGFTAESQAEEARINKLVSICIKDEEGNPFFKDVDEYRENNDAPFVVEAGNKLVTMIYGLDDGWESDLPENKFLKKFKFVDEELRLVGKEGEYVTIDNKKINKEFQYVDEDGKITDKNGNILDEDGLPIVEYKPFLDDDGETIND